MRKTDLTKELAERLGVSRAEAADQLNNVVADILRNLRNGENARLPGLGEFQPGPGGQVGFTDKGQTRGK